MPFGRSTLPGVSGEADSLRALAEAIAWRSKVADNPKAGVKPTRTTLDEFWPVFIRTGSKRGTYEPATKALYEQQFDTHIKERLGHWPLPALSAAAIPFLDGA